MGQTYTERRIKQTEWKEAQRAKGICFWCAKNLINLDRSINLCSNCLDKSNANSKKTYKSSLTDAKRKYNSIRSRRCHFKNRREALAAYGAFCVCCGEANEYFLELDHVNNDGAAHRKHTRDMYLWAKKFNYPNTLQVLCSNCNQGKRRNRGVCPHQEILVKEFHEA